MLPWVLFAFDCCNVMLGRGEICDRCGAYGIDKDNKLRGPLEGRYEYLCKKCAFDEGLFRPLRYKPE